jgi:ABC-type phosphate/phosphonate transport system substrate-binding protein
VPPWQRGQSADDIRRLYEPLLDYLGRATNAKITVVTARNYEDMVHYFADGRVDPVHEHRRPEELTNEELMAIAAGGLRKAPQVRFRVGHVREL